MMELPKSYFFLSTNLIITIISIFLLICYYLYNKTNYWKKRGVPYISMAQCWRDNTEYQSKQEHYLVLFNKWYETFKEHKYVGIFSIHQPILLITDPETIKLTLVKAFTNFHDRNPPKDEKYDELAANIVDMTGERWHQVRQKVSAAFSSAKMKIMYEALKDCARELNTHLQTLCSKTGETEIEMKELMSNYTLDVIGACAMGIKCNAIRDPNCEIKKVVEKMFRFDRKMCFYFWLEAIHPRLPGWCGLKVIDSDVATFLRNVCRETMQMKEEAVSSTRKDFLQILMNIRSSEISKLTESTENEAEKLFSNSEGHIFTEKVLIGVISSFLSAGFEPVASTLTFCLYELACHPSIQENIFKEIKSVKKEIGDDVTYEDLKQLKYTDQVINETLRKYPTPVVLTRYCTEPFKMPDSSFVVEKGMRLFYPICSIHHDPKYFPEPDKFDPGRFSEENINKIVPGTFVPFGDGPRSCIAMRLALMDIKTMLVSMVSNFTLHTCAKTQKIMDFDTTIFSLSPRNGLYLQLQKRN